MRVHLITAESPESRPLRRLRLIQFPQLTAALTPPEHAVSHTHEIVEAVRFDVPADLVGITAATPSALHAHVLAALDTAFPACFSYVRANIASEILRGRDMQVNVGAERHKVS